MKNFNVLFRTEWIEAVKELKLIWLSLFFVILGMTQPLVNQYMDVILKSVGSTDGIIIDPNRPMPTTGEILLSTFSGQYNQFGLIVLIISLMGIIMTDKNNGIQDFIFTRPVTIVSYVLSKLFSHWLICSVCIVIGAAVSYVYTVYLFGSFSVIKFILFLMLYLIWILYIVSLVIVLSTFLKRAIGVAVLAIIISMVSVVLSGISTPIAMFLPSGILKVAESLLLNTHVSPLLMIACVIFIFLNIYVSHLKMKRV